MLTRWTVPYPLEHTCHQISYATAPSRENKSVIKTRGSITSGALGTGEHPNEPGNIPTERGIEEWPWGTGPWAYWASRQRISPMASPWRLPRDISLASLGGI